MLFTTWTKAAYRLITAILFLAVLTLESPTADASVQLAPTNAIKVNTADSPAAPRNLFSVARTCAGCVHYRVAPEDSLHEIAERFDVPGGWPSLYAANRRTIGRNPDLLRVGLNLRVTTAQLPSEVRRSVKPNERVSMLIAPAPYRPAATLSSQPRAAEPAAAGKARLPMMLLVGALLAVLLVDPELVLNRRRSRVRAWPASTRRRVGRGARRRSAISAGDVEPSRSPAGQLKISVTDYDRLLVTRLANPATIVVCRPPQQTADGILAAARLVLSQAEYQVLAHHLGQSSSTEPAHS